MNKGSNKPKFVFPNQRKEKNFHCNSQWSKIVESFEFRFSTNDFRFEKTTLKRLCFVLIWSLYSPASLLLPILTSHSLNKEKQLKIVDCSIFLFVQIKIYLRVELNVSFALFCEKNLSNQQRSNDCDEHKKNDREWPLKTFEWMKKRCKKMFRLTYAKRFSIPND